MIQQSANLLSPILHFPLIRRIRRTHGMEHATIHMLTRRVRGLKIAGRADHAGFYLYGDVKTDLIWESAQEALQRMQRGERQWAIHPNCGTGLVTTSFMTSAAAMLGFLGVQNRPQEMLNRLPLVMLLSIVALVVSQPTGLQLQEHFTTLGDMGDLELVNITRHENELPWFGTFIVHRVNTRLG